MINLKKGRYWSESWNPVTGCTPISRACDNCWARSMASRFPALHVSPDFSIPRFHADRLTMPLRWRRPRIVATCWLGDLFHEKVTDDTILQVLDTIRRCPQHMFLLLTKRADRLIAFDDVFPINAWVGVSVEDQESACRRVHRLMGLEHRRRWVSFEPALGPVDWSHIKLPEWIVMGGENGSGARPADDRWFQYTRASCTIRRVPFFLKSLGAGRGRVLDGCKCNGFPPGLHEIACKEVCKC